MLLFGAPIDSRQDTQVRHSFLTEFTEATAVNGTDGASRQDFQIIINTGQI